MRKRLIGLFVLPVLLFAASCATKSIPEIRPHYQYLILPKGELRGLPAGDFSRPEIYGVKITDNNLVGGFCYTPQDYFIMEDYVTELEERLKDAYSWGSK